MYRTALLLVSLITLVLAGCGSGGSNSADPFSTASTSANTPNTGVFGNITTTAAGKISYKLTLSAVGASGSGSTVGPGSTVIATALLSDSDGNPIANQEVTFEKVDPLAPVSVTTPLVTTDSSGKAINFLKAESLPSNSTSSYDIIIKASATLHEQLVTSVAIFKIVRSAGNVISFLTSKLPTDPDGTLNQLAVSLTNVDPASQPFTGIVQLVPFQVLDSNGTPIPRQPVAVGIYSVMGGEGCSAYIDSPEAGSLQTVTTDDNGKGIFNAVVLMATPGVGSENSCSLIYRATTTIAGLPDPPVFSYGGFLANVKNELSK